MKLQLKKETVKHSSKHAQNKILVNLSLLMFLIPEYQIGTGPQIEDVNCPYGQNVNEWK